MGRLQWTKLAAIVFNIGRIKHTFAVSTRADNTLARVSQRSRLNLVGGGRKARWKRALFFPVLGTGGGSSPATAAYGAGRILKAICNTDRAHVPSAGSFVCALLSTFSSR